MFNPITAFAMYLMIWFITLFMVLPLWNVSHHEAGIEPVRGGDPGAPLMTNLKKKIKLNTVLAFVVWAILMLGLKFGWFEFLLPR